MQFICARAYDTLLKASDITGKHRFIDAIFPEKLTYKNKSVRTPRLNEVVSLITSVDNGLGEFKTKQAVKNDSLSNLAPPPGLEPGTY